MLLAVLCVPFRKIMFKFFTECTVPSNNGNLSECACVMAYQSSRLQTLESVVTWNLFQHSKHLYRYGIHILYYQLQMPSDQYARGFMLIKLILEVCKAKIDWL